MTTATQILIFFVILLLSFVLLFIGYQIYLILSETRKMLVKFNKVADHAAEISQNIGKSFTSFGGVAEGFGSIFKVVNFFKKKKPVPDPVDLEE